MKHPIAAITLTSAAALLTGCQTVPLGDPARSAELKKFASNPAVGQVYVCRDGRKMGSEVSPTIEVNGQALANLGPNNYYYIELPPGDHLIVAKTFEHDSKFPFKIAAGEQVYFQTWTTWGILVSRGVIDTIPAAEGKKCVEEAQLVAPLSPSSK